MSKYSLNTHWINLWKQAGAFAKPNGMTRYLKRPQGVLNAVFHSSPAETLNKFKAAFRSIFEKYFRPFNWFKSQDITGIG